MCWQTEAYSPPLDAVVTFLWFWRRIQNYRLTYLLMYHRI